MAEGYDGFSEESYELKERDSPYDDPFSLFAAVISGKLHLAAFDPYTLENNMVVMEILDAAVRSSKIQSTVNLK
jgi:predicted dehydrogenase